MARLKTPIYPNQNVRISRTRDRSGGPATICNPRFRRNKPPRLRVYSNLVLQALQPPFKAPLNKIPQHQQKYAPYYCICEIKCLILIKSFDRDAQIFSALPRLRLRCLYITKRSSTPALPLYNEVSLSKTHG